jgi:hypothetical protein
MDMVVFDRESVMIHSKITKQTKQMITATAKKYGVPENTIINTILSKGLTEGTTMAKKAAAKKPAKKATKKGY